MSARRSPPVIRQTSENDGAALAHLIQEAYRDVALRFSLTPQNCPKHPSNCTETWIRSDLERGVTYYLLAQAETPIGCAALETTDSSVAYLMRLAVRSAFRRRGYGEMLVEHIIDQAQVLSMTSLSIGLIAEQVDLVAWYHRLGFVPGEVKQFDHLPFTVRYMAYPL